MCKAAFLSRFILLLVLSFFAEDAVAQYDNTRKFTKAELRADVNYLYQTLVKAHPGIFWHTSPALVKEEFEQLEKSVKSSMTEIEFLRLVGRANSLIKCAHSDIRPSNELNDFWKENRLYIPINITRLEDKYYVAENLSGETALKKGTQLMAINRQPISEIVAALLPYIPADGDNETRKYYALRTGFYWYYGVYLQALDTDRFAVQYKSETGHPSEVMLNGITRTELKSRRAKVKAKPGPPIRLNFHEDQNTAVLKVASFRHDLMVAAQLNFTDFLTECFTQINNRNTETLIVDIRGNKGGYSEYGAELYAFLADSAFQYCERMVVNSKTLFPEFEYDIAETFGEFPKGIQKKGVNYIWPKHSILGWRQPKKQAFNGKVIFLIDGGCASTTSEFASIAKANNRGVFIGEEVGGALPGDNGGVLAWVELPNTKIRVRMGMVKYELAIHGDYSSHGVIPDYPIEFSSVDYRADNDPQLEFALRLAE